MHPSTMPAFFAPPMPFHPEELYKHVKQLEHAFAAMPPGDLNARIAISKAIIAATASFVEGCFVDLVTFTLSEASVPESLREWTLSKLRGLDQKIQFLKKQLVDLRSGTQVTDCPESKFVEGRMPDKTPGLLQLRNKVDHGELVEQADLRLNNVVEFRELACAYLELVYASIGVSKPGWMGT